MSEPPAVSRLRVGFYVFFPSGGIGRYTHELMRALGRHAGVEVEVLCSPDFEWKRDPSYRAWEGLWTLSHPVPVLRRANFVIGQFVNPRRAIDYVRAQGIDVLHLANVNHLTFPLWRRALDESGVPVVLSAHDIRRQKPILHRGWEERQLQAFYRRADALFVHSRYQERELIDFAGVAPERIHVVPHGPYPHRPVRRAREEIRAGLGLPADRPVALFFGQLRDEKNLDGFLEAMARAGDHLYLLVAGASSSRHRDGPFYRKRARQLGLERRVMFLDRFIEEEEVGELFVASDWVALPYREDFTSQSGVLNVAAHYRRPVLVSSAPVLRETVETCDIGVVAPGDTVEALVEGIRRMNERLAAGHAHAFEAYERHYSWERNAEITLSVYRQLLGQAVGVR
ncbi:glycosyltransferase family 4 protein [Rhodocaloribacter litoris]|uniref:glycosyltransferase family 4 protein n=1 Tax=Rhodocaloribacter litoris TaxID=2558931 RepID=UPI00141F6775|nr:glycosyltransferase family 4 protein [Rhodocaloribacter litoris]QXD16180.1 glycosyltransferase family 4 protein [Rhodocaloribacter litoris]